MKIRMIYVVRVTILRHECRSSIIVITRKVQLVNLRIISLLVLLCFYYTNLKTCVLLSKTQELDCSCDDIIGDFFFFINSQVVLKY